MKILRPLAQTPKTPLPTRGRGWIAHGAQSFADGVGTFYCYSHEEHRIQAETSTGVTDSGPIVWLAVVSTDGERPSDVRCLRALRAFGFKDSTEEPAPGQSRRYFWRHAIDERIAS